MTFSEGSLASVALLSAIFALSSFQQQDMISAAEYRRRALNAVWASAAQQATAQDVLRRIVCMNFLAIYEQIACPESPDEWTSSIFHSKTDIISVFPLGRMYHGDLSLILDWTYHYDLLFKFNMGRYKNMSQKLLKCAKKKHIMLARSYGTNQSQVIFAPFRTELVDLFSSPFQIVPTLGCSLEIFHTITFITDAGLLIELDGSTFAESFDKLERRLKYAVQDFHVDTKNTTPWLERETDHVRDIAELYRLAALIYLHRIGRRALKSVYDIQPFMSSSLDILNRLETCERTLPLFVIGCEAQSGEARSVILRLIGSTELAFFQCSNMTRLRGFLERFWALDDLDDLEESSYSEKITAVLSSGQSLPPFS
ncbi:hypothetical protein BS50DRAFT_593044 [Corynespora cassiicola Philippines]|uniref:Uncharacterized protein n=1 Tax=Corynespora cassiicola Philippines TaxID=1448308 RepID=A0A2T2N798_CORCC|nr:hypothetical protein BS50DRAFT_593044 [Corynespora cassiicola Philippines]